MMAFDYKSFLPPLPARQAIMVLATLALTLGGCMDAHRVPMPDSQNAVSMPAGDRHLIMSREFGSEAASKIICVEPAPDYATSFAVQQSLALSATAPNNVSGSASGSFNRTETIVALAGRTAGVVALRDGLYQACQAYANHVITRSDYALILSQYGDLLTVLVGQQPATDGGATADKSGGTGQNAAALRLANAHVQALLVSCLNAYDPEWPPNGAAIPAASSPPPEHALLSRAACGQLVSNIVQLSAHLLDTGVKDNAGGATNGSGSCDTTAPKAAPVQITTYQAQLRSLGLYTGAVDGKAGTTTRQAVLQFQKAHGLCPTGVVDDATAKALHITG